MLSFYYMCFIYLHFFGGVFIPEPFGNKLQTWYLFLYGYILRYVFSKNKDIQESNTNTMLFNKSTDLVQILPIVSIMSIIAEVS